MDIMARRALHPILKKHALLDCLAAQTTYGSCAGIMQLAVNLGQSRIIGERNGVMQR